MPDNTPDSSSDSSAVNPSPIPNNPAAAIMGGPPTIDPSDAPLNRRQVADPSQVQNPNDRHSILGRGLLHVAHALEGKQLNYVPDPTTGEVKEVVSQRKPGGLFRDIILGAITGAAAGAQLPPGTSPLAGFGVGAESAMRLSERERQGRLDRATAAGQQTQKLNQTQLAQASIAHDTVSSLDLGHHIGFHDDGEVSKLNNSVSVVKSAALKNGGQLAELGPNLRNGEPGNGPLIMAAVSKNPELLQGLEGRHRVPFVSYSTTGLTHDGDKWTEKDGSPVDWNKRGTVTLVDVPNNVWNSNVSITNADANAVAGYSITRGKPTDTAATTFGSLFSLGLKAKKDLIAARQERRRGPNDANEAASWVSAGQNVDPDDDDAKLIQQRATMGQAFLDAQSDAKNASKNPPAAPDTVGKAQATLSSAQIAYRNSPSPQNKQAVDDAQARLTGLQNTEVDTASKKKSAELKAEDNASGGGNGPTGAAYLASLPVATRNNLQAYYDGRLEVTASFARSKEGLKIIKQLTQAYPDFDASKAPAYFKMRQDFTSGKTADGITALNTAVSHLERAYDHTSAISTIPGIRSLAQLSGNKDATGLNSAKEAVAMELGKAYKNGVVTNDEAKSWKSLLDAATPAELRGNINELTELLTGRLSSLNQRWENGKPSDGVSPVHIASDSTRRIYKKITGSDLGFGSSSQNVQAAPATVSPRQQNAAPANQGGWGAQFGGVQR